MQCSTAAPINTQNTVWSTFHSTFHSTPYYILHTQLGIL